MPPLGGFPSEYCHAIWYAETKMAWLPDGEKISKLSLFVYVRTCQTHTHIHTLHDGIGRACIASHGTNKKMDEYWDCVKWPILEISQQRQATNDKLPVGTSCLSSAARKWPTSSLCSCSLSDICCTDSVKLLTVLVMYVHWSWMVDSTNEWSIRSLESALAMLLSTRDRRAYVKHTNANS